MGAFLPSPVIRFGCALSCLLGTGKPPFLEEQKETWAVREGETEGETAWLLFPAPQEEVVLGQCIETRTQKTRMAGDPKGYTTARMETGSPWG